jgi:hypothetical protein
VFFVPDNVILCEGQDDAYFYPKLFKEIGIIPDAHLYGYGAGGFARMPELAKILKAMGYERVVLIYDNGKQFDSNEGIDESGFPFFVIPTNDIRDKANPDVQGLFDSKGEIKRDVNGNIIYYEQLVAFIGKMRSYFST